MTGRSIKHGPLRRVELATVAPFVRRAADGAPGRRLLEDGAGLPEALLTIDQAAAVLNVPPSWQRDQVTARQVPHLRLGRHVRFGPEHLRQIMADGETAPDDGTAPTGRRHRRRPSPGGRAMTSRRPAPEPGGHRPRRRA